MPLVVLVRLLEEECAKAVGPDRVVEVQAPLLQNPQNVVPLAVLVQLLKEECAKAVGPDRVVEGLNASGDSFYSSQVCAGCWE